MKAFFSLFEKKDSHHYKYTVFAEELHIIHNPTSNSAIV